jgi:putative hydrolase of the HAD superfamily
MSSPTPTYAESSEPAPPTDPVRAVVFDLFGTLVDNVKPDEWMAFLKAAAKALAVPYKPFAIRWNRDTHAQRNTGEFATVEASLEHVCQSLGVEPEPMGLMEATRLRWDFSERGMKPRPEALDTLRRLKQRGLKLGLISDCTIEVPELFEESPLADWFDATLFSCTSGMCKPAAELYESMCEELQVEAGQCLYVGDGGSQELEGAARCGMRPVLICAPHEEALVMARSANKRFNGPKISRLSQILALLPEDS